MSRVVLDAATLAKLLQTPLPVEVCDEQGKVVGTFRPRVEPQVSNEELRRREQSDKWYTTAEVLAHLKRLEAEGK